MTSPVPTRAHTASAAPRILLLLDAHSHYESAVVARLSQRVEAAGHALVVVAAGGLAASLETQPGMPKVPGADRFHALMERVEVAGAIVLSGALGPQASFDQVGQLLARFARNERVPVVSLGVPLAGLASVGAAESQTLRAWIEHVTEQRSRHGYVFLRGYPGSHDSRERERAFRAVMAERGLDVREDWMLDAGFSPWKAFQLVSQLLLGGARPDGIVSANDGMAAAAVRACDRHGLRVPDDVVVAGFDDIEDARLSSPPLTTVRMPVDRYVDVAFELLQRRIAGWQVPADGHHVALAGELIVRGSTRSVAGPSRVSGDPDPVDASAGFAAGLNALFTHPSAPPVPQPQQLASDVAALLLHGRGDPLPTLQRALRPDAHGVLDVAAWQFLRDGLDALVRSAAGEQLAPLAAVPLSNIHGAIGDALRSVEHQHRLEERARVLAVEALHLSLGRCTDRQQVVTALDVGFDALDVRTACVFVYADESDDGPGEQAEPFFVRVEGRIVEVPAERFDTARMVPDALAAALGSAALMLTPAHVANRHYGFLAHDTQRPPGVSMRAVAQSIANALQNCRQIESLERAAQQMHVANADLARLAGRDALTGLHNRAGFLTALTTQLDCHRGRSDGLTLLYFDLDGFKAINDTHGHAVGDRLLRAVAVRVRRSLRSGDIVARLGGDEFTVILPNICERDAAAGVAKALLAELSRPVPIGELSVNLSASIGIARFPDDAGDSDSLLRHADAAMYRAKADGRNRYAWFCRSIEQRELEQLDLDRALRLARDAGELALVWQPRIALDSGRLLGFEALLRWESQDSVGRVVGPNEFVPLAERTGYVRELDAFALEAACRQQAAWQALGHGVRVSVNLSAASLRDDGLTERVRSTIERHAIDAGFIEMELTESAAMDDVDRTIEQLDTLRSFGLRLSIDDFGTAYSSLDYLKRLPVDCLKIDRAFVKDVDRADGGDGADAAIVRAIVALGHELGFGIVAEGVETEEQRDFLAALGCDEAQGYLFGRPLDTEAALARLDAGDADESPGERDLAA